MSELMQLSTEWKNRDDASMQTLEAKVLEIKRTQNYQQTLEACSVVGNRKADNVNFVAGLLRLVDERDISLSAIQKAIGIQLGHLFRIFDRAGVDFRVAR